MTTRRKKSSTKPETVDKVSSTGDEAPKDEVQTSANPEAPTGHGGRYISIGGGKKVKAE